MEAMPEHLTAFVASGSEILVMDAVRWNGEIWLVPQWLETPDGKLQTPGIAVRLDGLPHQPHGPNGADLTVNNPIPKDVLSGATPPEQALPFQVIHGPSLHFGNWAKRVPH